MLRGTDLTWLRDRAAIARTAIGFRQQIRTALSLLDDIATNEDASMGGDDIEDLCSAREVLARALGTSYNERTSRYHD